jgi:hypothetical protein
VLRVRAAGKKKCVVTIAGVNLTFDIFGVGMRRSVGLQAVKAVAEMKGLGIL